jgi:hypothetical protein
MTVMEMPLVLYTTQSHEWYLQRRLYGCFLLAALLSPMVVLHTLKCAQHTLEHNTEHTILVSGGL